MYYVKYVKGCTPEMKSFKTEAEAYKFVANFKLEHQFGNTDDNWIDTIFTGKIIYSDPSVAINGVMNVQAR
jgi:hypothetical protein